jgi:hypothetical protein
MSQLLARRPDGCSAVGDATGDGLVAVAPAGLVAVPGAGLSVTGTDEPGAAGCCPGRGGCCPGAAGCCPGTAGCCPCGTFVAGDCIGAAGFTAAGLVGACAPGFVPGTLGGFCAGGGDCATSVSARTSEPRQAMNGVFIVLLSQQFDRTIAVQECLYRKIITGESSKTFHFLLPEDIPFTS